MQRIQQNSLQQSNFMVSNDNVQIMDLPQRMSAPVKVKPSGRTTPILIPPIKYIVYNNPQAAYDFLISKGYNVDNRIPSVYQFARIFVKERGDEGVLELVRAAHPDKELILKAMGHKEDSSFCCGFDGKNEDPKQAAQAASATSSAAKEEAEPKKEKSEGLIKINTQTIIIILVIVVFFLLINRATK